jgi:hypothetical protein
MPPPPTHTHTACRLCFRPRPLIVDLSPSTRLAERVSEGVVQVLEGERDAVLYYLLARHPGRALVSRGGGEWRGGGGVWGLGARGGVLEGERDAVLYYLLARHPGRALVSVLKSICKKHMHHPCAQAHC